MERGKRGSPRILAIIIGGVIICILAALSIPLYTGYVERARISEGFSNVRIIIISQKVEKVRTGKYYSASTIVEFKSRRIPLDEPKFFTYKTVATPNGGFTVTATPTDAFGAGGEPMTFTYDPTKTPPGKWGNEELILKDWLLLQA